MAAQSIIYSHDLEVDRRSTVVGLAATPDGDAIWGGRDTGDVGNYVARWSESGVRLIPCGDDIFSIKTLSIDSSTTDVRIYVGGAKPRYYPGAWELKDGVFQRMRHFETHPLRDSFLKDHGWVEAISGDKLVVSFAKRFEPYLITNTAAHPLPVPFRDGTSPGIADLSENSRFLCGSAVDHSIHGLVWDLQTQKLHVLEPSEFGGDETVFGISQRGKYIAGEAEAGFSGPAKVLLWRQSSDFTYIPIVPRDEMGKPFHGLASDVVEIDDGALAVGIYQIRKGARIAKQGEFLGVLKSSNWYWIDFLTLLGEYGITVPEHYRALDLAYSEKADVIFAHLNFYTPSSGYAIVRFPGSVIRNNLELEGSRMAEFEE